MTKIRTLIAALGVAVGSLGLAGCHISPVTVCTNTTPGGWRPVFGTWGNHPGSQVADHYRCIARRADVEVYTQWCVYEIHHADDSITLLRSTYCGESAPAIDPGEFNI